MLNETDLGPDPLAEVARWLEAARAAGEPLPEAMALAAASPDGQPANRMVLAKSVDADGVTFFTNYESRKAADLGANPRAAAVFFWQRPHRQIRLEGAVSKISPAASDAYFRTRPYGARLSAAASPQSRETTRARLEAEVGRLRALHPDEVPRPGHWGGYRLRPDTIEFWQGREDRLHDRILFERDGDGWRSRRLAP